MQQATSHSTLSCSGTSFALCTWFADEAFVRLLVNGHQKEQLSLLTSTMLIKLSCLTDPFPTWKFCSTLPANWYFSQGCTFQRLSAGSNALLQPYDVHHDPRGTLQRAMQFSSITSRLEFSVSDLPWVGDFLNLCFNPRSSMLMFILNLSVMEVNNRVFPEFYNERPMMLFVQLCKIGITSANSSFGTGSTSIIS